MGRAAIERPILRCAQNDIESLRLCVSAVQTGEQRTSLVNKDEKQKAAVARLHSLPEGSDQQVQYALEVLERERGMLIVPAALAVVARAGVPDARPVLLRLYDYYDADGTRRDSS